MNPQIAEIPVIKMHGTGNDFIVCDLRLSSHLSLFEQMIPRTQRGAWAKNLCQRQTSVGADGLLILESHSSYELVWDFYNSDGSSAEMCGNAARCVAVYIFSEKPLLNSFEFLTLAGPIKAIRNPDGTVTIETIKLASDRDDKTIQVDNKNVTFRLINTGVPHSVISVEKDKHLTDEAHKKLARHIRFHPAVGPKGSNVTFYREESPGHISSVSFERGVEDFTLACGTGVLAAGLDYCQNHHLKRCRVSVPGGELSVQFDSDRPRLSGPAVMVARLQLADRFWSV